MATVKKTCRKCSADLVSVGGSSSQWECSGCGARFAARSKAASETEADGPAPERSAEPEVPASPVSSAGRRALLVGILSGALVFASICLFVFFLVTRHKKDTKAPEVAKAPSKPTSPSQTPPPKAENWKEVVAEVKRDPVPIQPVTVPADPAKSGPPSKANQAIDRGVAYLKGKLNGMTKIVGGANQIGSASLIGLTLLECGEPANDPAIKACVTTIREEVGKAINTYELSLALWFLDRLGQPQDEALIQTLALRLIAGQQIQGGWNYTCPHLSPELQNELMTLLQKTPIPDDPAMPAGAPPTNPNSAEELKKLAVVRYVPGTKLPANATGHEDNSITQFAILALWSARKHHVPVERSLTMVEARFRASQGADGSWGYTWSFPNRRDSMTCAGLLGLAVGRGVGKAKQGPQAPDPAVEKALTFLGGRIGGAPKAPDLERKKKLEEYTELSAKIRMTTDRAERAKLRARMIQLRPALITVGPGTLFGADSWGDLYFLWSLERMSVVYDLKTVAGKDWYVWGSEIIVNAQNKDGSWSDSFPVIPDTCFALLFLKRVNIVKDLTIQLRLLNKGTGPDAGK